MSRSKYKIKEDIEMHNTQSGGPNTALVHSSPNPPNSNKSKSTNRQKPKRRKR